MGLSGIAEGGRVPGTGTLFGSRHASVLQARRPSKSITALVNNLTVTINRSAQEHRP
jgi:hypothetical protein